MGLISRVSSRTYRKKVKKNHPIMVWVKDVNQTDFVYAFASFLKKTGKINVPKWSDMAKTATQKQMSPASDDWFYVRTAAIARQLYMHGTRPSHTRHGNGHIARCALQELEKMKLVAKA